MINHQLFRLHSDMLSQAPCVSSFIGLHTGGLNYSLHSGDLWRGEVFNEQSHSVTFE